MNPRPLPTRAAQRLRASPDYVLAFSQDGRPYVAQETEPHLQYWLSQRYRVLLALFSGQHGASIDEVLDAYFRLAGTEPEEAERRRLAKAVDDMRAAGVLVGARDDVSRQHARMARDHLRHRPFPQALADFIVRQAPVGADSRVLDLAGGPGSLALALARVSGEVTLMELSRAFVQAARVRAARLGLRLDAIHESCHRLMYSEGSWDVVTVTQALHWLDDVQVCRGVRRVLRPGGSFFVVQEGLDLARDHPLAPVLGPHAIASGGDARPFALRAQALLRRLALLFEALDGPDAQRQPSRGDGEAAAPACIVPVGLSLFRQQRPFEPGYARALLTPRHIEGTGQPAPVFWRELEARCAKATPQQLLGHMDWAVLQFRRGGEVGELADWPCGEAIDIGWEFPAEA